MIASIIIRTYNEEKHLSELLAQISNQITNGIKIEVIIVDSGSTDNTLQIASQFNTRIVHIKKSAFSFGRSLNIGCEAANGQFLVIISGHCIPCEQNWLTKILEPLIKQKCVYTYARQIGNENSKFSEKQLLNKYFPAENSVPSKDYFCNNANAAITKEAWQRFKFDELLTGLEDMDMAKKLVAIGLSIGYVAEAPVYHLHDETWHNVKTRYEREAIALQKIMPEVRISFGDFIRYYISALFHDFGTALTERVFLKYFNEIIMFRLMQYWGTYKGNHGQRKISEKLKEEYFYPK